MTLDEMPPVMRELFKMLPPPGAEWPLVERVRWMRAFEAICPLIFKGDRIQIAIEGMPPTDTGA